MDSSLNTNYTYTLLSSGDAAFFSIIGSKVQYHGTPSLPATKWTYQVIVRTTDDLGGYLDKTFTLTTKRIAKTPSFVFVKVTHPDVQVRT